MFGGLIGVRSTLSLCDEVVWYGGEKEDTKPCLHELWKIVEDCPI